MQNDTGRIQCPACSSCVIIRLDTHVRLYCPARKVATPEQSPSREPEGSSHSQEAEGCSSEESPDSELDAVQTLPRRRSNFEVPEQVADE